MNFETRVPFESKRRISFLLRTRNSWTPGRSRHFVHQGRIQRHRPGLRERRVVRGRRDARSDAIDRRVYSHDLRESVETESDNGEPDDRHQDQDDSAALPAFV